MENLDKILELEEELILMDEDDKISLWNEYCDDNSYGETIYSMVEIDVAISGMNALELIELGKDGFNVDDPYFYYREEYGWGLASVCDVDDVIETFDVARWLIRNDGYCHTPLNEDIEELFEKWEEEDNEDEED